jgi:hypothetical protein
VVLECMVINTFDDRGHGCLQRHEMNTQLCLHMIKQQRSKNRCSHAAGTDGTTQSSLA